MKESLKRFPPFKYAIVALRTFRVKPGFISRAMSLGSYLSDYRRYRSLEANPAYKTSTADLFPRIYDKTALTDIDPVYFIQGCWCAGKVFKAKPAKHYDIGSQALMVGIISQFTPTTMVDIRPLSVSIPGLSFLRGDITALPFKDGEISSLSSICVIEHIGLGRYGDPLDQFGTEKAAKELMRVLAPGGSLYISVPVDNESKTYFNAHRAFTRDHVLSLFKGLRLDEESYIYGRDVQGSYDASKGFGTGLYAFSK
jgi:SAM-dependent methyltransferase